MADNWKYLFVTPDTVRVSMGPDDDGSNRVVMLTEYSGSDAPWLAPDIRLGLSMTPEEARMIAKTLLRKADEAEA